jgi:DNA-binding MarR family transcriptional regulator
MSSRKVDSRMGDPYATIGFALKQAQQALRTHLDAGLRDIGLTTPQYAVLAFLEVDAGASNAALARRAFVTPQTMQAILVTLERAGFIARTPHPELGRVQMTELTASGRKVLAAATGIVAEAEARLRNASAPLDPQVVTAMLLRLAETLR